MKSDDFHSGMDARMLLCVTGPFAEIIEWMVIIRCMTKKDC